MLSGIDQWYIEKNNWVNKTGGATGHYESIISPEYQYVAISAFLNDETGRNITVGEFQNASSRMVN